MKTDRAIFITILVMSLLNVITFKTLNIPQGCYTMLSILTSVWIIFDVVYEGDHIKYYNRIKKWFKKVINRK